MSVMRIHPAVRPRLTAGSYTLESSQTMAKGGSFGTRTVDSRVQHLEVTAPRVTMDPGEVFSVTPPPHSQGPFGGRLPHIALKRRTLPWDRQDNEGNPWLALVMLAEGEGTLLRGVAAADCYSDNTTVTGLPDEMGDCLEVVQSVVDRCFPARTEIGLLTHVREADASDTELADDDHWVSVVFGNRVPLPGTAYRCMLISIEGQLDNLPPTGGAVEQPTRTSPWDGILDAVDHLRAERVTGNGFSVVSPSVFDSIDVVAATGTTPSGGAPGATGTTTTATSANIGAKGGFVRLDLDPERLELALDAVGIVETKYRFPVLATWEFECSDVAGDFGGIMKRLDVKLFADPGSPEPDHRRVLPTTLATGHVDMTHTNRRGATGSAWYRGPAVPVKVTRDPAGAPFHVADQARSIGPGGVEDISYASAFEVGRLLAMSDPQFLAALRRWAAKGFRVIRDRSHLDRFVPGVAELPDLRFLDRHLATLVLLPDGIGGNPILVLPDPRPIHPDAPLIVPDDLDTLAAGFGVAKATVNELAGPGMNTRPVDPGRIDGGVLTPGDALGEIDHLREVLDNRLLDRAATADRLADLRNNIGELGLLDNLLEGP